ncbi:MmcQ/YjbR family DNA-binding protein [Sphingomonas sp. 1P06PA]|uniref:MmcQ/YjbR family DNA-binding protein n=1 Tax=Sphingomonas sp. 1P06PA TaxID=554121 RepID=UPI0039A57E66
MTWDDVCAIARDLPGVVLGTSYGTPAHKVRGKLITRLRAEEGGTVMVLLLPIDEVEHLIETDPACFYQTPHYQGHGAVLVRLPDADPDRVATLVERAWSIRASKAQRGMRGAD